VKEKNWMPFVLADRLYMVHSVFPHRVFRLAPNGTAVQQWVTRAPALFEPYKNEDIHGGPPLVAIPADRSPSGQGYFLGILHFFQVRGTGCVLRGGWDPVCVRVLAWVWVCVVGWGGGESAGWVNAAWPAG
jgi:hypothetical protein